MKTKEAIASCKIVCERCQKGLDCENCTNYAKMKALQRITPAKPVINNYYRNCPYCNSRLETNNKYPACRFCGQAIDWS